MSHRWQELTSESIDIEPGPVDCAAGNFPVTSQTWTCCKTAGLTALVTFVIVFLLLVLVAPPFVQGPETDPLIAAQISWRRVLLWSVVTAVAVGILPQIISRI